MRQAVLMESAQCCNCSCLSSTSELSVVTETPTVPPSSRAAAACGSDAVSRTDRSPPSQGLRTPSAPFHRRLHQGQSSIP